MKLEEWAAVVGVAGFVLSLLNLAYSALRFWWQRRIAEPSASWEIFDYQDRDGLKAEHRLAIINHGPATMTDLEVKPRNTDRSYCDGLLHSGQPHPIPTVFPGQTIHVVLAMSFDYELASVDLQWRDRRFNQQTREIWLTHHHVR